MNGPTPRILIAANPNSGASSSVAKVSALCETLNQSGFDCEILTSLEGVRAASLQAEAVGNLRAVISAGGDGTVDALANLLPATIPLQVFPLGTENLLAKYLGLRGDIRQACATAIANRRFKMDAGVANGKIFLVMLSVGFDAEVVRQMTALRRGHISRWSYVRPIFRTLLRYGFPALNYRLNGSLDRETVGDEPVGEIPRMPSASKRDARPTDTNITEFSGESNPVACEPLPEISTGDTRGSAAWVFVFNVPRYAASLNFCPQADPTDGLLDICTFSKPGIAYGLGYFARLRQKRLTLIIPSS